MSSPQRMRMLGFLPCPAVAGAKAGAAACARTAPPRSAAVVSRANPWPRILFCFIGCVLPMVFVSPSLAAMVKSPAAHLDGPRELQGDESVHLTDRATAGGSRPPRRHWITVSGLLARVPVAHLPHLLKHLFEVVARRQLER